MIHEDERRTLEDFPEGKLITAKEDCFLGDHYHKIKTEKFVLVKGSANFTLSDASQSMTKGVIYSVLPGQRHSFALTEGSILIGLCSHPYDPTDDYK